MILVFITQAWAQTTTSIAPVVEVLQQANDKMPAVAPAWAAVIFTFAVELIMRAWPTVKPRSLFILVAQVFGLLGNIFSKISSFLDSILQVQKEPKA